MKDAEYGYDKNLFYVKLLNEGYADVIEKVP